MCQTQCRFLFVLISAGRVPAVLYLREAISPSARMRACASGFREDLVVGRGHSLRPGKYFAYHLGDRRKRQPAVQKGPHRHLPRRVERARVVVPPLRRGKREIVAGEAFPLEGKKTQTAQRLEIERLHAAVQPLRIGERQLNGQLHGGIAQLRQNAAVRELHHRMYDALRLYDGMNLFERRIIQPFGLDDLEALVQKGGAVYRDFGAHVPGGVPQRVGGRHPLQLLSRVRIERPAAGRDDQPPKRLVRTEGKRLPDGGMFAVHGQ